MLAFACVTSAVLHADVRQRRHPSFTDHVDESSSHHPKKVC